jgi:hypothetical protein
MSNVSQTAGVKISLDKMEVVETPGQQTYIKIEAPDLVQHVKDLRKAAGLEGVDVSVSVGVSI